MIFHVIQWTEYGIRLYKMSIEQIQMDYTLMQFYYTCVTMEIGDILQSADKKVIIERVL